MDSNVSEEVLPLIQLSSKKRIESATKRQSEQEAPVFDYDNQLRSSGISGPIKAFASQSQAGSRSFLETFDKISQKSYPKPNILEPLQAITASQALYHSENSQGSQKRSHSSALNRSQRILQKSRLDDKSALNLKLDRTMTRDRAENMDLEQFIQDSNINITLNQVQLPLEDRPNTNQTADLEAREQVSSRKAAQQLREAKTSNTPSSMKLQNNNLIGTGQSYALSSLSKKSAANNLISSNSKREKLPKKNRVNQFKATKMTQKEVIDFLLEIGRQNVIINTNLLPYDLNSTQAIDSFLDAIAYIATNNIQKRSPELFDNIHLSTGTRTPFVQETLHYIIKHQAKESMFIDAVEFFSESLEHMIEIEKENDERKGIIDVLRENKQELTTKWFDLERMLVETSTILLKLRQSEHEQAVLLQQTKKQLDAKKAECESLHCRLKDKNEQDLQQLSRQSAAIRIAGTDATQTISKMEDQRIFSISNEPLRGSIVSAGNSLPGDNTLEHDLNQIQSALEQQVEEFKQNRMTAFQGACANFQRVQEHLNAVQIKNKNLIDENTKITEKLLGKERLVAHLESKVTQIMVDNEEQSVKLKSEIVLLQMKIDAADENLKKKMMQMKVKIEDDARLQVADQISQLELKIKLLTQKTDDQEVKNKRILKQHEELQKEFEHYRTEKIQQERLSSVYLKETENKLAALTKLHVDTKNEMRERIEHFENQAELKTKECQILFLRLKYLRQSTDVLMRQKLFLMDTLTKSKEQMNNKMQQLEESMLSQNKNKSFLVSVEKAVKQSRNVADCGNSALHNIEQIVKFFKVEKIHTLVFNTEAPTELKAFEETSLYKLNQEIKEMAERQLDQEQHMTIPNSNSDRQKKEEDIPGTRQSKNSFDEKDEIVYNVERTQQMLDSLRQTLDLPVNFKSKPVIEEKINRSQLRFNQKVIKNEEYYLDQCPVEVISILLKFIVETLTELEIVSVVEEIPHSISRLLYLANSKSDIATEREIFDSYLYDSKKAFDDEVRNLTGQILTQTELRALGGLNSFASDSKRKQSFITVLPDPKFLNIVTEPHKIDKTQINESPKQVQYNVLAIKSFERTPTSLKSSKQKPNSLQNQLLPLNEQFMLREKEDLENEINLQKIKIKEIKDNSKELQKNLAEKIIKLEETIDFLKETNEEKLNQIEYSFKQEVEQIQQGVHQREKQLLHHIEQLQERNVQLENTNNIAQDEDAILRISMQRRNNSGHNTSALPKFKSRSSIIGSRQSVKSLVAAMENDSQNVMSQMEDKIKNYQSNVKQFLNIREQTMGTISLVFEANESNSSMINEAILSYYLSKCFQLPKDKFRILSKIEFVQTSDEIEFDQKREYQANRAIKKPQVPVFMVKIVFEIVEDHQTIEKDILRVKTEIKDGSSLLYDLTPSYMGINFGHSGLMTRSKLSDTHILLKQGKEIYGQDYVISLMRSTENPYVFMVLCLDLKNGEEFILELHEYDIFQITEGNQGLLEDAEPQELAQLILDNIELFEKDGVKFLTCEHKVFFNSLWSDAMVSNLSKSKQLPEQNKMQKTFDLRVSTQKVEFVTNFQDTSFRDQKLLQNPFNHGAQPKSEILSMLYKESECQTGFESSQLYEANEVIFTGNQRFGEQILIYIIVSEAKMSQTLVLEFFDSKRKSYTKFSMCQNQNLPSMPQQELSVRTSSDELIETPQTLDDQYMIHTECLKVKSEHLVLVCVEKIQNDGLLIKLHDLRQIISEEFYLIRKTNGQFTRINPAESQNLLYKEEFRSLVFDLAFAQQAQSQDIMMSNIVISQEKMQQQGKNPNKVYNELYTASQKPKTTKVAKVRQITSFITDAFAIEKGNVAQVSQEAQNAAGVEEWKGTSEKGLLLYRETIDVRCNFQQKDNFDEQKSLISLYLKDNNVNIEVFLYNDAQQMSITSTVSAEELFGRDPLEIEFCERIRHLRLMLEKLFVLQEDNKFHMKVESDAEPISQVLERKLHENKHGDSLNQDEKAKAKKFSQAQFYEDRIREIQLDKDIMIRTGKLKFFSQYVNQNDVVYEVKIYVSIRNKKNLTKSAQKRIVTYNKTQQQIMQQKIENVIDEIGDFDMIYIEVHASEIDDIIFLLVDKRLLSNILSKDVTCEYEQLIVEWPQHLIPYIFEHVIIDIENKQLKIQNQSDVTELISKQAKSIVGGQVIRRRENFIIDEFPEESNTLFKKSLVMNQEVDFTELTYDIKLYKVMRRNSVGSGTIDLSNETIAYVIEIFNINEPEVIYKYRLPLHQTGENAHDPNTFYADVFNLIDHPFQNETGNSVAKRKRPVDDENQDEFKVNSSKYQALFRKYIDNQLMLVIQETKFPANLSFSLVEPTSRLLWKFDFEIQNEILNPASFSLVDPGSFEKFMTAVYDCSLPVKNQILKPADTKHVYGNWNEIDKDNHTLFVSDLGPNLSILIDKHKARLRIQFFDKEEQVKNMEAQRQFEDLQQIQTQNMDLENKTASVLFDSELDERISFIQGSEINLDLRMFKIRGTSLIAKIVTIEPPETKRNFKQYKGVDSEDNIILTLQCQTDMFIVTITRLVDLSPLARLEYEYENPIEEDIYTTQETLVNQVNRMFDVQAHLLDSIRQINSSHIQEQIVSNYQILRAKLSVNSPAQISDLKSDGASTKKDVKIGVIEEAAVPQVQTADQVSRIQTFESTLNKLHECSQHNSRFYQRHQGQEKTVTLHRKIFYDEVKEKLIIITVNLVYIYGAVLPPNSMLMTKDAQNFIFNITEPESNMMTQLKMTLEQLFSERQLATLNRKDLTKLKQFARIILEERSVIKRKEDTETQEDGGAAYTLEFLQEEFQNMSQMSGRAIQSSKGQMSERNSENSQSRQDNMHSQQSQEQALEDQLTDDQQLLMEVPGQNDNEMQNMRQHGNLPQNSVIMEEISQEDRDQDQDSQIQPLAKQSEVSEENLI